MSSSDHDIVDYLVGSDLFAGLGRNHAEHMASLARFQQVENGEYIFRSGEAGSRLFIVVEGMLSVEFPLGSSMYSVVQLLGPKRAVGWSCLGPEKTYTVSGRSLMSGRTVVLPVYELSVEADDTPEVGTVVYHNLTEIMSRRIESLAVHFSSTAPTKEWVEQCGVWERRKFTWRTTQKEIQAHCLGKTCTSLEGKDCPLVGRDPSKWHGLLPRELSVVGG